MKRSLKQTKKETEFRHHLPSFLLYKVVLTEMKGLTYWTFKQKLPKRQKIIIEEAGEDTMSKIPESLIHRILSFLPTKDAVRTSVLSKKWQFRWTFITRLDLNDTAFYSPQKKTCRKIYFLNFVYRALLFTQTSALESFSLVVTNKYDVSLLNTWISNILIRGVKNLRIDTRSEMSFSVLASHSLFNSLLIEELVLKMFYCVIGVTKTHVYFGRLKLLKLSGILFSLRSGSTCLNLNLPVLEVFETVNFNMLNAKNLVLQVPLLERVIIVHNAKFRCNETTQCLIQFSGSHLKEFSYCGYANMSHYFDLLDSSSTRNASVNLVLDQCPTNRDPETEIRAFKLLKQFSQVKCLKFECCEVLALSKLAKLPSFEMLSHLELGLVSGEVLLGLLLKSPILKTLLFKGLSIFDTELLNSVDVPECLSSTLQVVKFQKLHGCEHELFIAKFFMENGLVLERMSFSLVSQRLGKSKVMEEFKEKLFSFKKGFSFAFIEFSYDD